MEKSRYHRMSKTSIGKKFLAFVLSVSVLLGQATVGQSAPLFAWERLAVKGNSLNQSSSIQIQSPALDKEDVSLPTEDSWIHAYNIMPLILWRYENFGFRNPVVSIMIALVLVAYILALIWTSLLSRKEKWKKRKAKCHLNPSTGGRPLIITLATNGTEPQLHTTVRMSLQGSETETHYFDLTRSWRKAGHSGSPLNKDTSFVVWTNGIGSIRAVNLQLGATVNEKSSWFLNYVRITDCQNNAQYVVPVNLCLHNDGSYHFPVIETKESFLSRFFMNLRRGFTQNCIWNWQSTLNITSTNLFITSKLSLCAFIVLGMMFSSSCMYFLVTSRNLGENHAYETFPWALGLKEAHFYNIGLFFIAVLIINLIGWVIELLLRHCKQKYSSKIGGNLIGENDNGINDTLASACIETNSGERTSHIVSSSSHDLEDISKKDATSDIINEDHTDSLSDYENANGTFKEPTVTDTDSVDIKNTINSETVVIPTKSTSKLDLLTEPFSGENVLTEPLSEKDVHNETLSEEDLLTVNSEEDVFNERLSEKRLPEEVGKPNTNDEEVDLHKMAAVIVKYSIQAAIKIHAERLNSENMMCVEKLSKDISQQVLVSSSASEIIETDYIMEQESEYTEKALNEVASEYLTDAIKESILDCLEIFNDKEEQLNCPRSQNSEWSTFHEEIETDQGLTDNGDETSKQDEKCNKKSELKLSSSSVADYIAIPMVSVNDKLSGSIQQEDMTKKESSASPNSTGCGEGPSHIQKYVSAEASIQKTHQFATYEYITSTDKEEKPKKKKKIYKFLRKMTNIFKHSGTSISKPTDPDIEANDVKSGNTAEDKSKYQTYGKKKNNVQNDDGGNKFFTPAYTYPALKSCTLDQIKEKAVEITISQALKLLSVNMDLETPGTAREKLMAAANDEQMKKYIINTVMDVTLSCAEEVMEEVDAGNCFAYQSLYMYQIGCYILGQDPYADIASELAMYKIPMDAMRGISQNAFQYVAEDVLVRSIGWTSNAQSSTKDTKSRTRPSSGDSNYQLKMRSDGKKGSKSSTATNNTALERESDDEKPSCSYSDASASVGAYKQRNKHAAKGKKNKKQNHNQNNSEFGAATSKYESATDFRNMDVENEEGMLNIAGRLYNLYALDDLLTKSENNLSRKYLLPYPITYFVYALMSILCAFFIASTVVLGSFLELEVIPSYFTFVCFGLLIHWFIMEPIKIFIMVLYTSLEHKYV